MATHIVSWGGGSANDSDYTLSPVASVSDISSTQASSIVSVDSIVRHKWTATSAVQGAPAPESLAKSNTYSRVDLNDESFIRHHKYFFSDGNVTFLVDGTLYCVHRYFFSRDSVYFSTRFDQLSIRDHEAVPITISLGNVKRKDFEAFLAILYPENFEERDLSYEEWKSVLHLSTCWDFTSIRRLALNNIQPPTPHVRLLLARTYSVDHWVIPALSALCEREAPLRLDEARQMDIEDVVLVATVREDIRSRNLQVDAAEILHRVEAARAGKLVHIDSVDVSPAAPAVPTSGAVEQASDQGLASKDGNTYEVVGEVLGKKQEAPENIGVRTEEPAQSMEDSQAEEIARCNIEKIRRQVKERMRWAEEREMMERKAEEAKREASLAQLTAKAEEAKCKAEAAEREAEAARVVILEAVTEHEKAVATEVSRMACRRARRTRRAAEVATAEQEAKAKSENQTADT